MTNGKILVFGVIFTIGLVVFLFWSPNEVVEEETETAVTTTATASLNEDGKYEVIMFKNPGCDCCVKWADQMNEAEFIVKDEAVSNLNEIKATNGITRQLASCHTAVIGEYIVEGHVPIEDVQRMMKERPDAIGLTVPGMPIGSPGMEVEGRPADKFDVLLINKDGSTSVYASH